MGFQRYDIRAKAHKTFLEKKFLLPEDSPQIFALAGAAESVTLCTGVVSIWFSSMDPEENLPRMFRDYMYIRHHDTYQSQYLSSDQYIHSNW